MSPAADLELSTVDAVGTQLDHLLPEWDALARQTGAGFAASPAFGLAWWQAHGRGRLAIVTGRRDGRLVAAAPLHRRVLAGRPVLRWLGHGQDVLGEVVALDPAASTAMWVHLLRTAVPLQLARTRLDGLLALRRAHVREPVGRLRISAVGKGRLLRAADSPGCATAEARPPAPRAAVELLTDPSALQSSWPELQGLLDPAQRAEPVDRAVLGTAAAAGDLVMATARSDGTPVAVATLLRRGSCLELWSLASAPSVDRLAFGDLLVRSVLDRSVDLGVQGVDLAIGGAELEAAWSGEGYEVVTLLRGSASVVAALGALQAAEDARRRRGTA